MDYRECPPTAGTAARLVIVGAPAGITPGVAEFTVFGEVGKKWMRWEAIKFKQGFGRLIRSKTDTGIVVVLDKRIVIEGVWEGFFVYALPGVRGWLRWRFEETTNGN